MSFSRESQDTEGFDRESKAASSFRDTFSWRPTRLRPRGFGIGKFGVGLFSPSEPTKYAWARVKATITSLLLVTVLATGTEAVNPYCESTDATTTNLSLCKPRVDFEGEQLWGNKYNFTLDEIDATYVLTIASMTSINTRFTAVGASTAALNVLITSVGGSTQTLANAVGASTAALSAGGATTYVQITGDTMTGPLTVPDLVGPLTVSAGSMTVVGNFLAAVSSAPVHYIGTKGSAAAPALAGPMTATGISFGSSGDDDDMNFAVNGTVRGVVKDGVGLCGGSGQSSGQTCLRSSAGSKADPGFQFVQDGDTGIYRAGANDMRLAAGGVDTISNTATETVIFPAAVGPSSFTTTGLRMGGAQGYIVSGTSITTSGGFFGNGAGLTGLSGASVSADNTWTANNTFNSTVYYKAGTSTGAVVMGIIRSTDVTSNIGLLETFTSTRSIPAGTLVAPGEYVEIIYNVESTASGGATRNCKVYFDGTLISGTQTLQSGDAGIIKCTVTYDSATTGTAFCVGNNGVTPVTTTKYTSLTVTWANALPVKGSIISNIGSNDVRARNLFMRVNRY